MSTQYARKFAWWWKEPGKAKAMVPLYKVSPQYYHSGKMICFPPSKKGVFSIGDIKQEWLKRSPKITREQLEELSLKWYVEQYSESAFFYELHARREFGLGVEKPKLRYAFGKPFHKLTLAQIEMWQIWEKEHKRMKAMTTKDAGEPTSKKPFPYVCAFPAQLSDSKILQSLNEKATSGHSASWVIQFNLKEFRDNEITEHLTKHLLAIERAQRGIPEPAVNKGKNHRNAKEGKTFTDIEALDVFHRLSPEEAKKTSYDDAVSRRAKSLIKEEFGGK